MGIAENRPNKVLGVAQPQLEPGEQVAALLPVDRVRPRDRVRVLEYERPGVWGKLVLDEAGAALKLNVHRSHRDDADGLVHPLGAAAAAA